jgi:outer membrane protein assembly factor BamD
MLRVIKLLVTLFTATAMLACSSDEKKADTAEGAYEIAKEFEKSERYEEAIRHYQEVKNKFPYSKYATLAELDLAETYFKQESYPEAQVAYQTFKELHPKHADIDYVTFRLAMSYYNQLPETIDRDLALTQNAMQYFDEVAVRYPNSKYVAEAKEKKADCLKKLAEKEDYIAHFYFIREMYDSALGRYEGLLKKYPQLGFDAEAMAHAAICAVKIGEMDRARAWINKLKAAFPGSSELAAAERIVGDSSR